MHSLLLQLFMTSYIQLYHLANTPTISRPSTSSGFPEAGQETTSAWTRDSPSSHGASEKSPVTTQESSGTKVVKIGLICCLLFSDGVEKIPEEKFPFEALLVELESSREEDAEEPIAYPEKDILASVIFNTITNQETDPQTNLPILKTKRIQGKSF